MSDFEKMYLQLKPQWGYVVWK